MKMFWLIILAIVVLAFGGIDEMPALAEATARREEWQKLLQVPSYVERQAALFASADLSQLVAEEEDKPLVVILEDDMRHTINNPYCDDPGCPCHTDEALFAEYIEQPMMDGLLTSYEASRLQWGETL